MNNKYINFKFRKLKISDYEEFRKLFYSCFKKKITFEFFKWRYFNDKFSFCYGVFDSAKLIANVGMVSIKLSNKSNEIIFSRHSSMVSKKYRGQGIFSELQKKVKKKISKKISIVFMWPNKNNFASFGIKKKNIIKKKYYLYKKYSTLKLFKKINYYPINKLINYKKFIKNNRSLLFKNFNYYKKRYLSYQNHNYLFNKFVFKNLKSFFILKRNNDKSGLNYVILDHFGSQKIYSKHLSHLINNQNKLIFLSKKQINKPEYELVNEINLKIGFIKKFNIKKNFFLSNKDVFLGDTDIFITTK